MIRESMRLARDEVVCPYCGYIDGDKKSWFGGQVRCFSCGKMYYLIVTRLYSTAVIEENDDAAEEG